MQLMYLLTIFSIFSGVVVAMTETMNGPTDSGKYIDSIGG